MPTVPSPGCPALVALLLSVAFGVENMPGSQPCSLARSISLPLPCSLHSNGYGLRHPEKDVEQPQEQTLPSGEEEALWGWQGLGEGQGPRGAVGSWRCGRWQVTSQGHLYQRLQCLEMFLGRCSTSGRRTLTDPHRGHRQPPGAETR